MRKTINFTAINGWLKAVGVTFAIVTACLPANAQRNANVATIEITTADELMYIGTDIQTMRASYVLMNDIEVSKWQPIGFSGVFDGNGHTITITSMADTLHATTEKQLRTIGISNYYIDIPICYVGLFSTLKGTVKNLRVEGEISIETLHTSVTASMNGATFTIKTINDNQSSVIAGGITGVNNGRIQNCISNLNINIAGNKKTILVSNIWSRDPLIGIRSVSIGGIAGINNKVILNCCVFGDIISMGDGTKHLGGITGDNSGNIFFSYTLGSVSAFGEADWSYAGGITGINGSGAALVNCVAMNSSITVEGNSGKNFGAGALIGTGKNANKHKSYAVHEITISATNNPNSPRPELMVSTPTTQDENFWKRKIKGYDISFRFGTNDERPWIWDGKVGRPRLFWEK